MPSSYPAGFDSFGNPIPNDALDSLTLPHATDQHDRMNDAMEAVQHALGLNPQGDEDDVAARLSALEGVASGAAADAAGILNIFEAKGDLVVGTADNTPGILPVGPDGWILVADSSTPTGLDYTIVEGGIGSGIPPGGLEGQALVKLSNADYDVGWADIEGMLGGGSGAIIATEPYPTGGTIDTYTEGPFEYRYHVFDTTGGIDSLVVTNGVIGNLLMVAGGGGGAMRGGIPNGGGGGGAGGLIAIPYAFGTGTHNMQVGAGGPKNSTTHGEDTWFDALTAIGGGNGGHDSLVPGNGGSGGGAGSTGGTHGNGTLGQGHDGGNNGSPHGHNAGGGGGGAGTAADGDYPGVGLTLSITGTPVEYAHGGYPGAFAEDLDPSHVSAPGKGGQGGGHFADTSTDGFDGIVIVRYRIA